MNTTNLRTNATTLLHRGGLLLLGSALILIVILNAPQVIGAEHSYVVLSGSMAPAYNTGDVVIVQSVSPTEIQEGDVITFHQQDTDVTRTTHRVTDVVHREQGLYFQTKGDANENPDPHLVPESHVIGQIWFSIPYVGYVFFFAQSRSGIVLLVIVPAALLILTEVWELFQTARTPSDGEGSRDTTDTDDSVALDSAEK